MDDRMYCTKTEDAWLLRYHEELESCIAHHIGAMQNSWKCGCKLGEVDVSPILLRYLWYKCLNKRPKEVDEESCRRALEEVERILSPLVNFKAKDTDEQTASIPTWHEYLKGQEGKILIFATSPRILNYFKPLVKELDMDFILLTTCPLPNDFEISSKGTAINFVFTKAKLHRNLELEQSLPWFYNFANSIGWFVELLKPRLFICMDGCQSEYRLAADFCNEKHIPSICLQLGWPSYIHTGFREMPYTYFFTWGEGFNPLLEKHNKHTKCEAVGYTSQANKAGKHDAISFFLQAPVFLNTEEYLKRMCNLVVLTAKKYPNTTVMVREHPEYKGKMDIEQEFSQHRNISIVSDDRIEDVYAETKVVVSHFSSVLMEGLAYGCTPLVFDPTPGSTYNPNIEKLGLGYISKNEEEFSQKLTIILKQELHPDLSQWFKATGDNAITNVIHSIHHLLV